MSGLQEPVIRLISTALHNIKNVRLGKIHFGNYGQAMKGEGIAGQDVTGIYGQNGNGKTAEVDALDILRCILSGTEISYQTYAEEFSEESAEIDAGFYLIFPDGKFRVRYIAILQVLREQKKIVIAEESFTCWRYGKSSWTHERKYSFRNAYIREQALFQKDCESAISTVHPQELDGSPLSGDLSTLAVYCAQNGQSIFFNGPVVNSLLKLKQERPALAPEAEDLIRLILALSRYGRYHLIVIRENPLEDIPGNPTIQYENSQSIENMTTTCIMPLVMTGKEILPKPLYPLLESCVNAINVAVMAIVPDLQIELEKVREEINDRGEEQVEVKAYSARNSQRFSIRYESEGIKHILSLLVCLSAVYNDRNTCLVVDDLDSHVFEYLYGEMLGTLNEEGKGQLIFTSHILRAMEKLGNKHFVCTTTNPDQRYIRLHNVKVNNNLRDYYIRALSVGGQDEVLYDTTDLEPIGYAFRKAAREYKK